MNYHAFLRKITEWILVAFSGFLKKRETTESYLIRIWGEGWAKKWILIFSKFICVQMNATALSGIWTWFPDPTYSADDLYATARRHLNNTNS